MSTTPDKSTKLTLFNAKRQAENLENYCENQIFYYARYNLPKRVTSLRDSSPRHWDRATRGGVEDTRLEAKAKAKDTKKIRGQGQGQPFRGQTLSRPRTGMLEAKAKDQGHKAQVLSKKKKKKKRKGLHKNFSSDH